MLLAAKRKNKKDIVEGKIHILHSAKLSPSLSIEEMELTHSQSEHLILLVKGLAEWSST